MFEYGFMIQNYSHW